MKRAICFVLAVVMLVALCACQPTPEKEIVANKGDGVLEQRISEAQEQEKQTQREQLQSQASPVPTPTPQPYEHPDTWMLELDLTNFFVHIQAEVEVPQGAYPVVRLSQSDFSEKEEILSTLLTRMMGEATGKRQDVYCYEDYVDMMEECVRGVFDPDTNTYRRYYSDEQEEADRKMAEYAEKLKTALHREEFDEDGTLVTGVNTAYTYCGADGTLWYVRIEDNQFSVSTAHSTGTGESGIAWKPDFPGDTTPPPLVITVTKEQAKAQADALLADLPDMDWEMVKIEQGAIYADHFFAIDPVEWASEGYLLTYTRRMGNTSFFEHEGHSNPSRLNLEETPYTAPVYAETLHVFVDEKGVQSLTWWYPITVEDTVAGNVELLPFEQIQEQFVSLLKAGLSWADEHPPYQGKLNPSRIAWVEQAVLSYAYIQEKDNPGKFLAVPTWFFSYEVGEEPGQRSKNYVALNAVDGTRVSLL